MFNLSEVEKIESRFLETTKNVAKLYAKRNELKKNYQDMPTLLDYQANLVEIGHKLVKAKYLARELMVHYINQARTEHTQAMIESEQQGKQSTYAKSYAKEKSNISQYESEKWENNYKKFRDMVDAIKNDQISIHSRYKYMIGNENE